MKTDDDFKYNKGDWSEFFAFLKILTGSKIYHGNDELNPIPDSFFEPEYILKTEDNDEKLFLINDSYVELIINSSHIKLFSREELIHYADHIKNGITRGYGRGFNISGSADIVNSLFLKSIKAGSNSTADIILGLTDQHLNNPRELGFSIKSYLGRNPTMYNVGPGTNWIYKIIDYPLENIRPFNVSTYDLPGKIHNRIKKLVDDGYKLKFDSIASETNTRNLMLLDTDMPKLVSYLLLYRYYYNDNRFPEILKHLSNNDPLDYGNRAQSYYDIRLKRLLFAMASGMTPETEWNEEYQTNGGSLVVNKYGQILSYPENDISRYKDFLITKTKVDMPATSEDANNPGHVDITKSETKKRFTWGYVYEDNGEAKIKINLQVKYI